MGSVARNHLAIALASVLLLAGILLIARARGLLPVDEPAPASPQSDEGHQTARPAVPTSAARQRPPARTIAQDMIAPPQLDPDQIERVEARPPLSDLGLAVPPKTPMPDDWREVLLFRPIATSSATFEAMGRTLAISGIQGIEPDRICSFHDAAWPCGQRARAAFNSWLRGRALSCFVPPETERFAIATPCRLGRQDAGAWLVSNGWATALPNGTYGKAEATARRAGMGIFGPPQ